MMVASASSPADRATALFASFILAFRRGARGRNRWRNCACALLGFAPGEVFAQCRRFALAAIGLRLPAAASRFGGGFRFGRGWPVVIVCHANRLGFEPPRRQASPGQTPAGVGQGSRQAGKARRRSVFSLPYRMRTGARPAHRRCGQTDAHRVRRGGPPQSAPAKLADEPSRPPSTRHGESMKPSNVPP